MNKTPDYDKIYTIPQVAEMLCLPAKTIKAAIVSGELEAYKFGTKRFQTRIPQRALSKWLDRTTRKTL